MKKIDKQNYIILQVEEQQVLGEFIKAVSQHIMNEPDENYVIDLLGFADIDKEHIKQMVSIHESIHPENYSLVVLIDQLKVEELPEEINTVPTLKEAEDVIQMEMIERDLGF
jgi:hypothetical protein